MQFANRLKSIARRIRASAELKGLAAAGGDATEVALAIREAWAGELTTAEQAQVDRIETLRKRLYASTEDLVLRDFGAPPLEFELDEKPGWVHRRKLGEFAVKSSKPYRWALLLFKLVRRFQPRTAIELGTCVGMSACFQSAALQLNGRGRLTTFEGATELAAVARRNLAELMLPAEIVLGLFHDTLAPQLRRMDEVDYAFIDGHHDEKATLDYFTTLYPALTARSLVVFDDIDWTDGMKGAWKSIEDDSRVTLSINLGPVGVCVVDKSGGKKRVHRVHLGSLFG
jgi:predicted O-methyltransferase YrrM